MNRSGLKMPKFVVIGHRGNGMNVLQSSDRRMRAIKENSIMSFNAAANFPLDFIEFDVQVSFFFFFFLKKKIIRVWNYYYHHHYYFLKETKKLKKNGDKIVGKLDSCSCVFRCRPACRRRVFLPCNEIHIYTYIFFFLLALPYWFPVLPLVFAAWHFL